ncbi:MAG: hypothetical protein AB1342_15770 [Pseudomonadota bacterium]
MKNKLIFTAAIFAIAASASMPSASEAATCDNHKTKLMWRSCMSKEIDRLNAAINAKALDLCYGKTNSERGPAAVDERLACRIDRLTKTLQGMN